jgi:quinol monooxygenase YgiN
MPMYRIAELEIAPESLERYKELLAEEIETSLQLEPGVLFLFAVSLKERPQSVRVFEGYADQVAYETHIATAHFLKYKTGTADMVLSLKLLDSDCIAMHAKGVQFGA